MTQSSEVALWQEFLGAVKDEVHGIRREIEAWKVRRMQTDSRAGARPQWDAESRSHDANVNATPAGDVSGPARSRAPEPSAVPADPPRIHRAPSVPQVPSPAAEPAGDDDTRLEFLKQRLARQLGNDAKGDSQ